MITIGDIPPPVEIYPSVGSGHHRTKRKKARRKQRAQNSLSVFSNPDQGVLGKMNRGDWRIHYPNTLPQRMTSLSLLACSFDFSAEMVSDFAGSFQAWPDVPKPPVRRMVDEFLIA